MTARAVIRHPRILFLDESTAALDTMRFTRIAVQHRLSTIIKTAEKSCGAAVMSNWHERAGLLPN